MDEADIRALARMLDRLDYYRLLRVKQADSPPRIKVAYLSMRRGFHPDAHMRSAPDLREAVGRIAKLVNEGYQVLRDPARRAAYDQALAQGELRFTADALEACQREVADKHGATESGKRFWKDAQAAEQSGDLTAAVKAVKMALTFERDNEHFRAKLADLEARAPKKKKANPFVIR